MLKVTLSRIDPFFKCVFKSVDYLEVGFKKVQHLEKTLLVLIYTFKARVPHYFIVYVCTCIQFVYWGRGGGVLVFKVWGRIGSRKQRLREA